MAPKPAAAKRLPSGSNFQLTEAYIRKPLPPPDPTTVHPLPPPSPALPPTPVSLDAVLLDWNDGLLDEKWDNFDNNGSSFIDTAFELQDLPPHLRDKAQSWARAVDILNPAPSKVEEVPQAGKKGAKEVKKPAAPPPAKKGKDSKVAVIWTEKDTDDTGRILPKVVCDGPATGIKIPGGQALTRPFLRQWTKQQQEILLKLQDPDLAQQGSELIAPSVPEGEEFDPVFTSVVRVLEACRPSLVVDDKAPYLWTAIYPQTPEGKPVYNPGGKYCVKLWVAGKWRKVIVDDRIPLDENQTSVCASTDEPKELWPLLLSKALYKLYNLTGTRALAPDIHNDTGALAGFVSYTLHALTGSMPDFFNNHRCLTDTDDLLERLLEGGTPIGDNHSLSIDHTPWVTIQANKPLKKRLMFRKKKKHKKGFQVYFDEVEHAAQQQKDKMKVFTSLLEQQRSKVYVACYMQEIVHEKEVMVVSEPPVVEPSQIPSETSPSLVSEPERSTPPALDTTVTEEGATIEAVSQPSPPSPPTHPKPEKQIIRTVQYVPVLKPLLAISTNTPSQAAEGEVSNGGPRVLLSFSYIDPSSDVMRDDTGAALHKKVKGDPTRYFYKVKEEWCPLAELVEKGAMILSLVVPSLMLFKDHLPFHWTVPAQGHALPPALPGPTFLHVASPPKSNVTTTPIQLFLGLVKDRETRTKEDTIGQQDPLGDEVMVYLQEVGIPQDPKLVADAAQRSTNNHGLDGAKSPPHLPVDVSAVTGAGALLEEGVQDEEHEQHAEEKEVDALAMPPPPSSIFLSVRLSSSSLYPFGCASLAVPPQLGGRLFRVHVHASYGATVLFGCNNATVKVGDAATVWKTSVTTGSMVEEQGNYEAVPAGTCRILFRRLVKVEAFSGPGHVMIQLHLKDKRIHRYVRLVTVDNDTGEEVEHPLLCTGYLKFAVNKLGYTVMATYLSSTQDCPAGSWRLLLFSDARIQQPLIKHDCGQLNRYGGVYTPNKYLRLFRDVISAPVYPLALRLTVTDPTMYLRLRIFNDKTNELVKEVCHRRFLHVPSLGLDQNDETDKKYIIELSLDAEHMDVPATHQSVRPYYFSQTTPSGASDALEWSMDVISSVPVSVNHDITDLNRFAKVRSAWEAAQPGRAERAKKVRDMYLKASKEGMVSTASQRLEVMGNFLTHDKEMRRLDRRKNLLAPTVIIHKNGEVDNQSPLILTEEELALRLTQHQDTLTASVAKLADEAQKRKDSIRLLQEEVQRQCKQLEDLREASVKRKDEVWKQRESYRQAHLARLAQEEAALAAAQAPTTTKKK